jgi:hypothetical protein
MVPLTALWLPILLSAVLVFIASSIIHMALGYHRSDYKQLPDEDKLLPLLRGANLQRGLYVFPFCTHKDMKSAAMQEKYRQGPVGMLTILPSGPPAMAKFLGGWFVFCIVVSLFVAYLAGHTLPLGARHRAVFRVAGTAPFLAYALGNVVNSIWKGQQWSMTIKEVFDGFVYSVLTAGTFSWLWPR